MANQPAPMGYIGSVQLFGGAAIRATSCSINTKQQIDHPEVIDGTVDWTLYQLKGIETQGDIQLPVMSGGASSLSSLLQYATKRNDKGELINEGEIIVSYGKAYGRKFAGCKINTLEVRATAGDKMDATVNVWGTTATTTGGSGVPVTGKPTRVMAWADILISGAGIEDVCLIKEFSFNINNNLQRNYTFCAASGYFPHNISTGKRNISGSMQFIGPAPTEQSAIGNKDNINPTAGSLDIGTTTGFKVSFKNIIWEYQTLEAQPSVIVSTANWFAHADGGGEAIA